MKALSRHLEDYLKLRRQLGFKLTASEYVLRDFVRFARQQGASVIRTKLVLHWVTQRPNMLPSYRAQRLSMVRGFAKYLSTVEPSTEVPPKNLVPGKFSRREPFHYTEEQVLHLIEAARNLAPSQEFEGLTFATLLGLLSVTGMRVGEALALDRGDIDCAGALLTVRRAKGNKSRLVPLHASTVQALQRYTAIRDEVYPQLACPAFFVRKGIRLPYYTARLWYIKTACAVGLRHHGDGRGGPRGARVHDLRHYFAIRTLLNWYRSDADVEARLPELATFLGHTTVRDTYWYLSAVPELLASATHRWERADKGEK